MASTQNDRLSSLGHDVGILGEGVGTLTEIHAGKHMVDVVVGGLISAHCQQQVPHFCALPQLPVLHCNIWSLLGGPLRVAALVNVLDGMPAFSPSIKSSETSQNHAFLSVRQLPTNSGETC